MSSETEKINIEFVEKETFNVDMKVIDSVPCDAITYIDNNFINGEVPTKLSSKVFRVAYPFKASSLKVWFNGIREHYINIENTTDFSFNVDIISDDTIEVDYIRA